MAISGRAVAKALIAIAGLAVSAVLVVSVFYNIRLSGGPLLTPRFDFRHFVSQLPKHLLWLVPFLCLSALVIPLRALQWQAALERPVPFKERYHFVAMGAFVHNALPGKFGDLFRAFLMARTQKVPFLQSLGSVAVCKLLEFAALMLLVAASFLGPFADTMSRFAAGLRVAVIICVTLVGVVVLLARYAASIAAWLKRGARLQKLQTLLEQVSVGLGTARSFRGMAKALLFSIGPVLAPAIAYGVALQGIQIRGGLFAGAVVLGAIALGQAAPGLPAGTGIYFFVTSYVARNLGASADDAAAFAVLTNLGTVLSQVTIGAISVWIRKLRWADLKRSTGIAAEAMKHVGEAEPEPA